MIARVMHEKKQVPLVKKVWIFVSQELCKSDLHSCVRTSPSLTSVKIPAELPLVSDVSLTIVASLDGGRGTILQTQDA